MECEPTFPWPSCEQPAVSSNWLPDAAKWPVKHGPHLYEGRVEAQTEDEVGGTAEATAEAGEVVEVKDTETPHDKWTSSEEERFFSALKAKGNDLQHITAHVSSKNIAQVRGYYQRLLKKINNVLRPLGVEVDHKDNMEVHAAMQSWWGMQQKLGEGTALHQLSQRPKKRKLFASSLKDTLVQHRERATKRNAAAEPADTSEHSANAERPGASLLHHDDSAAAVTTTQAASSPFGGCGEVGEGGGDCEQGDTQAESGGEVRGKEHDTPAAEETSAVTPRGNDRPHSNHSPGERAPFSGSLMNTSGQSGNTHGQSENGGGGRERLTLQLVPLDDTTKAIMTALGHCPHLELTSRAGKSTQSVLRHLQAKWVNADVPVGAQLQLFGLSSSAHTTLSWGSTYNLTTIAAVHALMGYPTPFRLKYAWLPPPPVHAVPAVAKPQPVMVEATTIPEEEVAARSKATTPVATPAAATRKAATAIVLSSPAAGASAPATPALAPPTASALTPMPPPPPPTVVVPPATVVEEESPASAQAMTITPLASGNTVPTTANHTPNSEATFITRSAAAASPTLVSPPVPTSTTPQSPIAPVTTTVTATAAATAAARALPQTPPSPQWWRLLNNLPGRNANSNNHSLPPHRTHPSTGGGTGTSCGGSLMGMEDISLGGFDWSSALRVLGDGEHSTPGSLPPLDLRRGFESMSGSGFRVDAAGGEHDVQSLEAPTPAQKAEEEDDIASAMQLLESVPDEPEDDVLQGLFHSSNAHRGGETEGRKAEAQAAEEAEQSRPSPAAEHQVPQALAACSTVKRTAATSRAPQRTAELSAPSSFAAAFAANPLSPPPGRSAGIIRASTVAMPSTSQHRQPAGGGSAGMRPATRPGGLSLGGAKVKSSPRSTIQLNTVPAGSLPLPFSSSSVSAHKSPSLLSARAVTPKGRDHNGTHDRRRIEPISTDAAAAAIAHSAAQGGGGGDGRATKRKHSAAATTDENRASPSSLPVAKRMTLFSTPLSQLPTPPAKPKANYHASSPTSSSSELPSPLSPLTTHVPRAKPKPIRTLEDSPTPISISPATLAQQLRAQGSTQRPSDRIRMCTPSVDRSQSHAGRLPSATVPSAAVAAAASTDAPAPVSTSQAFGRGLGGVIASEGATTTAPRRAKRTDTRESLMQLTNASLAMALGDTGPRWKN